MASLYQKIIINLIIIKNISMKKILDVTSMILIISLLLLFLSEKFFPINGLELIYQKKFYLAIAYLVVRVYRNFVLKKNQ